MADDFVTQVASVSALAEPARRALYLFVVAQPGPVSRDQAAAGTGYPRHTAKFHLDRLVDEGLLETEFRRLSERRGPGAGRPSKLYRRAEREVAVTLPERHYDLAAQILAGAVEEATDNDIPVLEAVQRAAATTGRRLGAAARATSTRSDHDPDGSMSAVADAVVGVLAAQGYEPRRAADTLLLTNCPFHALARAHTKLVCGMNLALITALLDEQQTSDLTARLDPGDDRCCVTVKR